MKRKQSPNDQPERRRALAEINLVGQKGSGTKPPGERISRRAGCAQMFGILSILAATTAWLAMSIGSR
jgi:hypothetical protein